MASFPLVPYANRIAHGRFAAAGREYSLPRNFGDHPHPLHGLGWLSPWSAETVHGGSAVLRHDHPGGAGWPWSYSATQTIDLTSRTLTIELAVQNTGGERAPGGLGLHPYFLIDGSAQLQFRSAGVWLSEPPDHLPLSLAPADALGDWSVGARVTGTSHIDHYYAGWDGIAILDRGEGMRLTLTASGACGLHVYRPLGGGILCLEPVSHMPDAINRAEGMDWLEPGQSRALTMTLTLAADEP